MRGPSCAFIPKSEVNSIANSLKNLGINASINEIRSTVTLMQSYNHKTYKSKDFKNRLFISELKYNIENQRKLKEKENEKASLPETEMAIQALIENAPRDIQGNIVENGRAITISEREYAIRKLNKGRTSPTYSNSITYEEAQQSISTLNDSSIDKEAKAIFPSEISFLKDVLDTTTNSQLKKVINTFINNYRVLGIPIDIKFGSLSRPAEVTIGKKEATITIDRSKFLAAMMAEVGNKNKAASMLLHELIHPLTVGALTANPVVMKKLGRAQDAQFAKEIAELYSIAQQFLGDKFYGMTSPVEFVAEAVSNPTFQKALKGIIHKPTRNSLWSRFIGSIKDFFKSLFGMDVSTNLFDQFLTTYNNYANFVIENGVFRYTNKPQTYGLESDTNKSVKIETYRGNWTREEVAKQSDKVFLFGDNTDDRVNTHHIPTKTQAVIRGLDNAIGIDTKKNRKTSEDSYFTNADFDIFKTQVDEAIQKAINSGKTIVIPEGGIGTGKAQLESRAPKLFDYLQNKLNTLKSDNITSQKATAPKTQGLIQSFEKIKIISGGQTGVDTIGLQVAKSLGIETGGTAPRGFVTEGTKTNPNLATEYGLVEISEEEDNKENEERETQGKHPNKYTARTKANVRNSDVTIYFYTSKGDQDNAGMRATEEAAKLYNKPFFSVDISNPVDVEKILDYIENQVSEKSITINIAGNRASKLNKAEIGRAEKAIKQLLEGGYKTSEQLVEERKAKQEAKAKKEAIESLKKKSPIDRKIIDSIDTSEPNSVFERILPSAKDRQSIVQLCGNFFSLMLDNEIEMASNWYKNTPYEDMYDEEKQIWEKLQGCKSEEEQRVALLNLIRGEYNEEVLPLPRLILYKTIDLFVDIGETVTAKKDSKRRDIFEVNEDAMQEVIDKYIIDKETGEYILTNPLGYDVMWYVHDHQESKGFNKDAYIRSFIQRLAEKFNPIFVQTSDEDFRAVNIEIFKRASDYLEFMENFRISQDLSGVVRTEVDTANDNDEGSSERRSGFDLTKYKVVPPSQRMSVRIKKLIASCFEMKDGKYVYDSNGLRKRINPYRAYYTLSAMFSQMTGTQDFDRFVERARKFYPWTEDIFYKLEDDEILRNEFYSCFRNVFVPYSMITPEGLLKSLNQESVVESFMSLFAKNYEAGLAFGDHPIYKEDGTPWIANIEGARKGETILSEALVKVLDAIRTRISDKERRDNYKLRVRQNIFDVFENLQTLWGKSNKHTKSSIIELLSNVGIDPIYVDLAKFLPVFESQEAFEEALLNAVNEREGVAKVDSLDEVETNDLADALTKIVDPEKMAALTAVLGSVSHILSKNNGFGSGNSSTSIKNRSLAEGFKKQLYSIATNLMADVDIFNDSSFRFGEDLRNSYAAPDFISEFVGIINNFEAPDGRQRIREFLEENFKKFDFFYNQQTNRWALPILETLYNAVVDKDGNTKTGPIQATERYILSNFKYTNVLGIGGNDKKKNSIGRVNDSVFLRSIVRACYASFDYMNSANTAFGYFRNPLFSDKDALVLFKMPFPRREEIYDGIARIVEAEVDRAIYYTNNNVGATLGKVFAKNSKLSYFFPQLNMTEIVEAIAQLDPASDTYREDRLQIISDAIAPYLEEGFERFVDVVGLETGRDIGDILEGNAKKFNKKLGVEEEEVVLDADEETIKELKKEAFKEGEQEEEDDGKITTVSADREDKIKQKETLRSFYLADFFNQMQLTLLLNGDPSYYKNSQEVIKRGAQAYAAGQKGYSLDREGKEIMVTSMYMNERIESSNTLTELMELFLSSSESEGLTDIQKAQMRGAAYEMVSKFKGIEATDGQSFGTLEFVKKLFVSLGKWNDAMESAYTKLEKKEPLDVEAFLSLWNSVKPFMYSFEERTVGEGENVRTEKVITQHKNSLYILSAMYTTLGSKIQKSGKLRAIHQFMKDRHIDNLHFKSVVKVGFNNPFDLMYDEEIYDEIVEKYRALTKAAGIHIGDISNYGELKKSFNNVAVLLGDKSKTPNLSNATRRQLKDFIVKSEYELNYESSDPNAQKDIERKVRAKLEKQLIDQKSGEIKEDMIHSFPLKDFSIVQPNDDHLIDRMAVFGSQLRNIMAIDLPENFSIEVTIRGQRVKLNKQQALEYYDTLITDQLIDSFAKIDAKFADIHELQKHIFSVIDASPKTYGPNVRAAFEIDETKGTFKIPTNSPNIVNKVEQLILGAFKKAIQRQEINGGNAVLVSNFALSNELHVAYKKDGSIDYIPAYLPAHKREMYSKYLVKQADGSWIINYDLVRQNGEEDLLNLIGYRIPTEARYSIMPIRVVGFMPITCGTTIMLPSDIITTSGTDFDIDKLFLMIKTYISEIGDSSVEGIKGLKESIRNGVERKSISAQDLKEGWEEAVDNFLKKGEFTNGELNSFLRKVTDSEGLKNGIIAFLKEGNALYTFPYRKTERGRLVVNNGELDINATSKLEGLPPSVRKRVRDNMLIDLMWQITTSKPVSKRAMTPAHFDTITKAATINRIQRDPAAREAFLDKIGRNNSVVEYLKNATMSELVDFYEKYATPELPADIITYMKNHRNLMDGNDLIGISAVNSSTHYKLQNAHKPVVLKGVWANKVKFRGITLNRLSPMNSPIDGHLLTDSHSEIQAAAPDNGKNPQLGDFGANTESMSYIDFLDKLGIGIQDIGMILKIKSYIGEIENLLDSDKVSKDTANLAKSGTFETLDHFNGDTFDTIFEHLFRGKTITEMLDEQLISETELLNTYKWLTLTDNMSSVFNEFSCISRCDSPNGALPITISEAIANEVAVQNFVTKVTAANSYFDNLGDFIDTSINGRDGEGNLMTVEQLREAILNSPSTNKRMQAFYTLGIAAASTLAGQYLPQFSDNLRDAVVGMSTVLKLNPRWEKDKAIFTSFYNDFTAYILSSLDLMQGKEVGSTMLEQRNYYIHDFPVKVAKILHDIMGSNRQYSPYRELVNYSFIRNMAVNSRYGVFYKDVLNVASETRNIYSEELDQMLRSDNAEVKKFAFDLLMYSMYANALLYRHNAISVFFSTDFLSRIPGFFDGIRENTETILANSEKMEGFLSQFIVNNPTAAPVIRSKKGFKISWQKKIEGEARKLEVPMPSPGYSNQATYTTGKMIAPCPFIRVAVGKNQYVLLRLIQADNNIGKFIYETIPSSKKADTESAATRMPYYNPNASSFDEFLSEVKELEGVGNVRGASLVKKRDLTENSEEFYEGKVNEDTNEDIIADESTEDMVDSALIDRPNAANAMEEAYSAEAEAAEHMTEVDPTTLGEADRPIPGDPDFAGYIDTQESSEKASYEELHKADEYEEAKGGRDPIDSNSIADDPDQNTCK